MNSHKVPHLPDPRLSRAFGTSGRRRSIRAPHCPFNHGNPSL